MRRIAAAAFALAAHAAQAASDDAHWYLQVDNDLVFGTDRWYSSGLRLARVSQGVEWGLLQEIYTPDSKRANFDDVDRVAAARLLLSVAHHDHDPQGWRTLEVALGVRGPAALGRQAQELAHRFAPAPPVDWSRQSPNRLDALVAWVRSQPLGHEIAMAHCGAVLENVVTFAHAGVELRVGSGAARTLSSPVLRFAPTPPMSDAALPQPGWSAFVGANERYVARNELLSHRAGEGAPELVRKPLIARYVAGVTWAARWGSVAFALVQDSREFDGQRWRIASVRSPCTWPRFSCRRRR